MAFLETLKDEITETKEKLEILQKLHGRLTTIPDAPAVISTTPPIMPHQFSNQAVGTSIRQIFAVTGRGMTQDEIQEMLLQGGADLGTYPKRTVKLALVNSPQYFRRGDGGLWYLIVF